MTRSTSMRRIRRPLTGFTLVEILLVVVILAILAAIVVPQFTHAASQSRENAIKMDLFRIRTQIEVYREQHNGNVPTLALFREQLTQPTDVNGLTEGSLRFGPYIREIPNNPETGTNDVTADDPAPDKAWYYDESDGTFCANHSADAREW